MAKNAFVVESEDSIRELVEITLSDEGYHVDSAFNAEEAEILIVGRTEPIDVIIVRRELRFGIRGDQFCETVAVKQSGAKVVLMSTESKNKTGSIRPKNCNAYIHMPFDLDRFLRTVNRVTCKKPGDC